MAGAHLVRTLSHRFSEMHTCSYNSQSSRDVFIDFQPVMRKKVQLDPEDQLLLAIHTLGQGLICRVPMPQERPTHAQSVPGSTSTLLTGTPWIEDLLGPDEYEEISFQLQYQIQSHANTT